MFNRRQSSKNTYVNRSKNREFELSDAVHLYNTALKLGHVSKLSSPWTIYYRNIDKTSPVNYCNKSQNNVVGDRQVVPCHPHTGVTPLATRYSVCVWETDVLNSWMVLTVTADIRRPLELCDTPADVCETDDINSWRSSTLAATVDTRMPQRLCDVPVVSESNPNDSVLLSVNRNDCTMGTVIVHRSDM